MRAGGFESQGRMDITVTKADEKGLTVSWPSAEVPHGQPIVAGSVQMNRHGRLITKGTVPESGVNLIMMMLPDKPVAVGEEFKVVISVNNLRFDLSGKLVKIDETQGLLAHFSFEGKFHTDGRVTNVKQNSVFDMARGLFTSGEMVIETGDIKRYFKLVEKGSGG